MAAWLVLTSRMWQKWYSNFGATLTRSKLPSPFLGIPLPTRPWCWWSSSRPKEVPMWMDGDLASHGIEATLDLLAHSATPPIPWEEENTSSQSTALGEIISGCYYKTLNFEVVYYTQEITETLCLFLLFFFLCHLLISSVEFCTTCLLV